jgi:hypothetical protein
VEAELFAWVTVGKFPELILKSRDSIRQNGWVPAALDRKKERAVQPRQLFRSKPLRLSLPQSNSRYSLPSLNLIVQRHHITPEVNSTRQGLQLLPDGAVYQLLRVDGEPGPNELLPTRDLAQLLGQPCP